MVENYFVYNSGGRWFPNPFGEWEIKIEENGNYEIKNFQGNILKFEKNGKLEARDVEKVWGLINNIDFNSINPKRTAAIPEEATHSFILRKSNTLIEKKILSNELRDSKQLTDLQKIFKEIIKKYVNKDAVF